MFSRFGTLLFLYFVIGFLWANSGCAQDLELEEAKEKWISEIEPGIRRIGVARPIAEFQCTAEPFVMPDGKTFLLQNAGAIFQFDSVTQELLNENHFPAFLNVARLAVSEDGKWIALLGQVRLDDSEIEVPETEFFKQLPTDFRERLAEIRTRLKSRMEDRVLVFDRDLKLQSTVVLPVEEAIVDGESVRFSHRSICFGFDSSEIVVSSIGDIKVIDWEANQVVASKSFRPGKFKQTFPLSPVEVGIHSSGSSEIEVWNRKTDEISTARDLKLAVNAMLLERSTDGTLLAFWSHPDTLTLLDPLNERTVALEETKNTELVRCCFAPGNQVFCALLRDKADRNSPQRMGLGFWEVSSGKSLKVEWLDGIDDGFTCRILDEDLQKLLVSHRDGVHSVLNLNEPLGPQIAAAFLHMPTANEIEFGNHDQVLAMTNAGFLNVEGGSFDPRFRFPGRMSPIESRFVTTRPLGKGKFEVQLKDVADGSRTTLFTHQVIDQDTVQLILRALGNEANDVSLGGDILNASFSPDGNKLFVLVQEFKLGVRLLSWDFRSKTKTELPVARIFPAEDLSRDTSITSVSIDGSRFAVNDHGTVTVVESASAKVVCRISTSTRVKLQLSRDGRYLAVADFKSADSTGRNLRVYRIEDSQIVYRHSEEEVSFNFASDADRFSIVPRDANAEVTVLDTDGWDVLFRHQYDSGTEPVARNCSAISSDGKTLAIGLVDGRVEVWDLIQVGN